MPFPIPTNQNIPIPGQSNTTEEFKVTQWLTYWQGVFGNFFNYMNRTAGGTGLDKDEIADRAIRANHFYPQRGRYFDPSYGAGPVPNNTRFAIHTVQITLPFDNAHVYFRCRLNLENPTGQVTRSFNRIERKTTPFTQSSGGMETIEGTLIDNDTIGKVFTIPAGTQTAFDVFFTDLDPKPAGTYFYRITVNCIDNSSFNVLNNVSEWRCETFYEVTNGSYS